MESKTKFFLTAPQQQYAEAQRCGLPVACMSYRIGKGPRLLRAAMPSLPRGGLMGITLDNEEDSDPGGICNEIFRECSARAFRGILCNFTPDQRLLPHEIVRQLGANCARYGMSLYVTEPYGAYSDKACVLISSALSGGSLQTRLEESIHKFGTGHVALLVEPVREDFFLPSPTGQGQRLQSDELTALMEQLDPSTFFSGELCAHYFTYMSKESGAHFVLYDDAGSIHKKIQLAALLGITDVFLPYHEVKADLFRLIS
ncbi:MAG: hypothetical protein LIO58_01915 [Oscillospiraceae bacterium]|nr:hypothetical protein [Oscillospiraceae bacterium]